MPEKIPYDAGLAFCQQLGLNGYSDVDLDFGAGFVYCDSHRRVHSTGWCTVPLYRKFPLDYPTLYDAEVAAKKAGLIDE